MKGSPVILDTIVTDFKALAAKIGPSFRVRDAEGAGAWSCYKGRATGLTFNAVKGLAGLPYKKRAPRGSNTYIPCKLAPKPGKKRQCLGILPSDNQCKMMVELPARLCHRCRKRNNTV